MKLIAFTTFAPNYKAYMKTNERYISRVVISLLFVICHLVFSDTMAQVRHYTVVDGLHTNEVRQVIELSNGQVLVNCEGVFDLFDGHSFIELPCDRSRSHKLSHYNGYQHLWDGDSLLWLRDFYYLYLFDARTLSFRYDIENRLAVNKELQQMAEETPTYETPDSRWQQIADSIGVGSRVEHMLVDRQGGLWFGTQTNGLFYIHSPRNTALLIAVNDSLYRKSSGMTDSHGRTWLCTTEGLECYENENVTTYTQDNVMGFIHNRMLFITELPDGRLLLCNHARSLGYFYPETQEFLPLKEQLPEQDDYRILMGACPLEDHKVAVYSQKGAFVLDTKSNRMEPFGPEKKIVPFTDKYNCMIKETRSGCLWIGTQNGLFIAKGDSVQRLSRDEGLVNGCIRSMVEDGKGNIWVGTEAGISRVTTDLRITNFGWADGVPLVSMDERAACQLNDGRLTFAYKGGLIVFHPEWFNVEVRPMPVILTSLEVNGVSQVATLTSLSLSYDQNNVMFRFSALNYASPEQTQYRYRLQGTDRDWQHCLGNEGQVTVGYSALSRGSYTLQAQASISGGEWGEPLILSVTILPPWWLTWWAKTGYALIVLALLITLIAIYIKRKKALIERENEAKVNRLFELREEARQQFAANVNIAPEKISINKEEEEFVTCLMKAIEQNMDNTDYTVDQLASNAGMSRSNLYRRTQSMLGITPNDFLRNVRLKYAAHLLSETDLPVNQVSAQCGFASPRYFAQYFKKMFGVLPSEYRRIS